MDWNTQSAIKLGGGQLPTWSPDGSRLAYSGGVEGVVEELLSAPLTVSAIHSCCSPELYSPGCGRPTGDSCSIMQRGPKARSDIWALPSFGDRKPWPLLNSKADENTPLTSANGCWLAYLSDESGLL